MWPPSWGTTSSRWTATQTPSTAGAARTTTFTTGSNRWNGGKHVFWVADSPDEYVRIFVCGKPILTLNQWWLKSFLTLPSDDSWKFVFWVSYAPDKYAGIFVCGKPILKLNQWWLKSLLTLLSDDTVENLFFESPMPQTNMPEYLFMASLFWN